MTKEQSNEHKNNIVYFEGYTMKKLYEIIDNWQKSDNGKRLLSCSIQKDEDKFCCIGVCNPTEVVICHGSGMNMASVSSGRLRVTPFQ